MDKLDDSTILRVDAAPLRGPSPVQVKRMVPSRLDEVQRRRSLKTRPDGTPYDDPWPGRP